MKALIAEILMHSRRLKKLWAEYDAMDEIEIWVYDKWERIKSALKAEME